MERQWVLPPEHRQTLQVSSETNLLQLFRQKNLGVAQAGLLRPDLWAESALLERLMYKNRSQHRSGHFCQKLLQVRRVLQLLQEMQLSQLLGDLQLLLLPTQAAAAPATASRLSLQQQQQLAKQAQGSSGMGSGADNSEAGRRHVNRVASRHAAVFVMQQLMTGCKLLEGLGPIILSAAAQLAAQLALSFFMPMCLTATAMLARIQASSQQLMLDCTKAYNILADLAPLLPQQHQHDGSNKSLALHNMLQHISSSSSKQPTCATSEINAHLHTSMVDPAAVAASAPDFHHHYTVQQPLPQMLSWQWEGQLPVLNQMEWTFNDSWEQRAVSATEQYGLLQLGSNSGSVSIPRGQPPLQPPPASMQQPSRARVVSLSGASTMQANVQGDMQACDVGVSVTRSLRGPTEVGTSGVVLGGSSGRSIGVTIARGQDTGKVLERSSFYELIGTTPISRSSIPAPPAPSSRVPSLLHDMGGRLPTTAAPLTVFEDRVLLDAQGNGGGKRRKGGDFGLGSKLAGIADSGLSAHVVNSVGVNVGLMSVHPAHQQPGHSHIPGASASAAAVQLEASRAATYVSAYTTAPGFVLGRPRSVPVSADANKAAAGPMNATQQIISQIAAAAAKPFPIPAVSAATTTPSLVTITVPAATCMPQILEGAGFAHPEQQVLPVSAEDTSLASRIDAAATGMQPHRGQNETAAALPKPATPRPPSVSFLRVGAADDTRSVKSKLPKPISAPLLPLLQLPGISAQADPSRTPSQAPNVAGKSGGRSGKVSSSKRAAAAAAVAAAAAAPPSWMELLNSPSTVPTALPAQNTPVGKGLQKLAHPGKDQVGGKRAHASLQSSNSISLGGNGRGKSVKVAGPLALSPGVLNPKGNTSVRPAVVGVKREVATKAGTVLTPPVVPEQPPVQQSAIFSMLFTS